MLDRQCRKRRRLEDLAESQTVNKFTDLIGRGQLSIAAAADIARTVVSRRLFLICDFPSVNFVFPLVFFRAKPGTPKLTWASKVDDHDLPHEALQAFVSLGTNGDHLGNQERDLHRWLSNLWGFSLQTYSVKLQLLVGCAEKLAWLNKVSNPTCVNSN